MKALHTVYSLILILFLFIFSGKAYAESVDEPKKETGILEQGKLREERPIQIHVGIYRNLNSVGGVYNLNKYFSLGAFYHKDNNLQLDMLYSTKDWAMDSIYFQGGDTYVYGASRAKLDWSGPQVFLNMRFFPFPDIPIYLSGNVGRDLYGDSGRHNVLLSYNVSQRYWVINPPIYMDQDGSPYWFRTAGIGTIIHLPYGIFIDGQYSEGMYSDYQRNMHIRNDERIFLTNGYKVGEGFSLTENNSGQMSNEEIIASTYLMNARHRERGHTGRHVIYDITIGYALSL
jgi:hypothetical protein